jgi:hypothetical protein
MNVVGVVPELPHWCPVALFLVRRARLWLGLLCLVFSASVARAQPDPDTDPIVEDPFLRFAGLLLDDPAPIGSDVDPNQHQPARGGLSPALQATVDALGASSGVPDGAGFSWYPNVPVGGQAARMGLTNYQAGGTVPLSTAGPGGPGTGQWYGNASARLLTVRTSAILPTDKVPFPAQFWDLQIGGAYLGQLSSGWNWGALVNFGTVSDRPFYGLAEATVSALAFLRVPDGERNAWLFFVVSTTNGQIGHNIPIPGVAYEAVTDRLHAVVGFPFVTINYRPSKEVQFEFAYAAFTDVLTRVSYYLSDAARVFVGYEWTNQSWFRAGRPHRSDQLFLYEMHTECGFGWRTVSGIDFRVSGGYAFDRFFVENTGFSLQGRNRVELAPGPYLSAQLEFKF